MNNNNKRISARGAVAETGGGEVAAKLNVIDFRARQMQHIRNNVYKEEEDNSSRPLPLSRHRRE